MLPKCIAFWERYKDGMNKTNFKVKRESNQLSEYFERKSGSVFVPYISMGDPGYEETITWADSIIKGGGDILELGIPFSDPVADGPVIQRAFKRAFEHPFSLEKIFQITKEIHSRNPDTPLVYLTYFNPIYQYGMEKFLKSAFDAGVSGFIIPDLPFDSPESQELYSKANQFQISLIHLVTPATEKSRIRKLKSSAGGFIYYVTSFGVTGERQDFSKDLESRISWVRKEVGIPVCAGFGISTPEQANKISQYSDGIIIGSSIQRIIEEFGKNPEDCAKRLEEYSRSIRSSLRN
jgi:tryptophan synthase alpha chain